MPDLPTIKIAFSDFWLSFDPDQNYFTRLLGKKFNLDIRHNIEEADYLIYSCFGQKHKNFKGIKIFYTGESRWPNYSECDYAFTFYKKETDRHCRLPYFLVSGEEIIPRLEANATLAPPDCSRLFCNFVYSNPRCRIRNRFFYKLSRYKKVDSGGRFMNNIGGPVPDKMAFISRYKFTFAFENSASRGYLTEKILEPLLAGSLPIYWGDPDVGEEFNSRRFIHYRDFPSEKALINHIIDLDHNDELYQSYFTENLFVRDNTMEEYTRKILSRFEEIFTQGKILRQPSRKWFYMGRRIIFGKKMFPYLKKR